jgi:hypothetical protein
MNQPDDDDEAPPASTQVLRVRKVGETFIVLAGESETTFATREEALAEARKLAGDRGGLILVEGEGGLDAEAVPPSSSR